MMNNDSTSEPMDLQEANSSELVQRKKKSLRIAIIAIYTACTASAGYSLTMVPNIEIFSMMVFLGGLLFGKKIGSAIGLLTTVIYRLFNIWGGSPLILLAIQLLVYTLVGFVGGLFNNTKFRKNVDISSQVVFGILGAIFATVYTFLTPLSWAVVNPQVDYWVWYLQGWLIPPFFTPVLIIGNLITFGLLMPLILLGLDKHLPNLLPEEMI
jgi:LytS/YehU family sensor histidine kinase